MLSENHCLNHSLGLFKPGGGLCAELFGLIADGLDMDGNFVLLFERGERDWNLLEYI